MQNYLLYNASKGIHSTNECRYALLKLLSVYNLKPPQDLTVVVHTGYPRLFDNFLTFFPRFLIKDPVASLPTNKAQLIQSFFATAQGNLLVCDTATYPLKPVELIFQEIERGEFFLYRQELPQTNGHSNILKQIMDGLPAKVEDVRVFNTAVTGLNYSLLCFVKQADEMISRLFPQLSHPFVINFAFSYAFQKQLLIKTANDYFADYFGLNEFRKLLHTFFMKNEEESIPNLVKLVHHLDAAAIQKEKVKHNRLPLLRKWWNELTGKGWSIRKYEKRIT